MPTAFHYERLVAWADTDAAGVVHFARFLIYAEEAEHALWRQLALPLLHDDTGAAIGWPRVHVACDYQAPLHFGERVLLRLRVAELGARSIRYDCHFFRLADGITAATDTPGVPVATATVTAVCLRPTAAGEWRAAPLPDAVRAALAPYVTPGA